MLPAAVVVTMAPMAEQVVLVIVSTDIPGGVVVMVDIPGPMGIAAVAPKSRVTRSIPSPLRFVGKTAVLLVLESEGMTPAEDNPETSLEKAFEAASSEVQRNKLDT